MSSQVLNSELNFMLASVAWRPNAIAVWNLTSGESVRTLHGHLGAIHSLAQLAGKRLASGASNGPIRIWNLTDGECIRTLTGHYDTVSALLPLDANGSMLASGAHDYAVRIWSLETGLCVRKLVQPFDKIYQVKVCFWITSDLITDQREKQKPIKTAVVLSFLLSLIEIIPIVQRFCH